MLKSILFSVAFSCLTSQISAQVTFYKINPEKINRDLADKMDSLYQEDQKYRLDWIRLEKNGANKKSLDSIKNIVKSKDQSNLNFIKPLIEKYGWLEPQIIGIQGSLALFLIIQHADLKTQKHYYPLIKQAEKEGNILSSNVAILEDRIAVRKGRLQTYGSQGYYDSKTKKNFVYPLKNFGKLDSLRNSMGLQPMKDYKKDWDIGDYLSYLPYAKKLLRKAKRSNKD